MDWLK